MSRSRRAASSATTGAAGWRRFLPRQRQMLWGLLAAFVAAVILVGVGYATTPIPNASSFATAQATTLYYSDGKTVMARLSGTTRVDVPLSKVPVAVQHAVLAAEDRQFYSEPGISPTGILRALWTDLRGGEISQGGSTITQQYVKNAYLTSARTFTRKFREIFIAVKLANTRSKHEILKDYLNTIYFGRGAYGIQAAAKAYFGKPVSALDAAQGAVLAAAISQPSVYDPAVDPSAAHARWHYVIDGMVKEHWLPAGSADTLDYPDVRKPRQRKGSGCSGDKAFICQAVRAELAQHGFDDQRLGTGGYKVVTTIDKTAQDAAEQAMKDNGGTFQHAGPDKGREAALVSVEPGDGAIRAMYGGSQNCSQSDRHPDSCTDLSGVNGYFGNGDYARPPGSSFKPYTLIAALQQGVSLDTTFHGPSHIDFPGTNGKGISNSEGESCSTCSLLEALAKSINTIFVPLAQQVGPDKVAQAAYDAGIPKSRHLNPVPSIALGPDDVSVLDQADAYATIAAQGKQARPYLVAKVESSKNETVYSADKKTDDAFDADVMADTTYAMTKVFDCSIGGTGCGKGLPGRPAAGKTGTVGAQSGPGNVDAWFVGFTPQLATAVWYGNQDRHRLVTDNGVSVYGAGLPASTWRQMMTGALQDAPVENFPPPAHVGNESTSESVSPGTESPASSTPSGTPSETPSQPTESPTSAPPILPSRSPSKSPSPTPTQTKTSSPEPTSTSSPQAAAEPSTSPRSG